MPRPIQNKNQADQAVDQVVADWAAFIEDYQDRVINNVLAIDPFHLAQHIRFALSIMNGWIEWDGNLYRTKDIMPEAKDFLKRIQKDFGLTESVSLANIQTITMKLRSMQEQATAELAEKSAETAKRMAEYKKGDELSKKFGEALWNEKIDSALLNEFVKLLFSKEHEAAILAYINRYRNTPFLGAVREKLEKEYNKVRDSAEAHVKALSLLAPLDPKAAIELKNTNNFINETRTYDTTVEEYRGSFIRARLFATKNSVFISSLEKKPETNWVHTLKKALSRLLGAVGIPRETLFAPKKTYLGNRIEKAESRFGLSS